jgi:putative FmdB family regulatory protein
MTPCFPHRLETILSPLYNSTMPTYEYACAKCGHQFEAVQSFSDKPISICPKCGGEVQKVYSNVGVVFKGGGFYKTDSRKESKPVESKPSESKPAE